jgi:hypothetical protein
MKILPEAGAGFIFQRGEVAAFGRLQSRADLGQGFAENGSAGRRILRDSPAWQPSVAMNLTIRRTEIFRNTRFSYIFYFSVQLICATLRLTKDCL